MDQNDLIALQEQPKKSGWLDSIKAALPQAPVFAFLERFDTFMEKKKRFLKKGEILFEPGENPYFYIVASWWLGIFRINATGEKKEIGRVYTGAFAGEGVFSGRNTKEVQAESLTENTIIIALEREDMEYYENVDAITIMQLYKHINNVTSLRLQESGKELALMYESAQKIQEFRETGKQWLIDTIQFLRKSFGFESCILIEEHRFIPGLYIYKYNSKTPFLGLMQSKIDDGISLAEWELKGDILSMRADQPKYCAPLLLGGESVGYILSAKNPGEKFGDSEKRVLSHITPMVASMLRDMQSAADEKAKEHLASAL